MITLEQKYSLIKKGDFVIARLGEEYYLGTVSKKYGTKPLVLSFRGFNDIEATSDALVGIVSPTVKIEKLPSEKLSEAAIKQLHGAKLFRTFNDLLKGEAATSATPAPKTSAPPALQTLANVVKGASTSAPNITREQKYPAPKTSAPDESEIELLSKKVDVLHNILENISNMLESLIEATLEESSEEEEAEYEDFGGLQQEEEPEQDDDQDAFLASLQG